MEGDIEVKDYTKKAVIRTSEEWKEVYKKTVAGDGFPCSPSCELPCLVLEADNPVPWANRDFQQRKVFIFITAL